MDSALTIVNYKKDMELSNVLENLNDEINSMEEINIYSLNYF